MKKALAIVLALLMALSLFACGNGGGSATTSPSANQENPSEAPAGASGNTAASNIGYFDPNYDYSKNPKYKVVYMMSATSVLYDMFDKAFKAWADRANVDYTSYNANGDNDLFITTIETYASQGYNGFLLDADNTIYPRVNDVMNELNLPWMSCMAEPLDENGERCHPTVGFDNYQFGVDMASWCIDYAKKNWPDAKPSEIGLLSMDFSLSPQIHQRTEGAKEVFLKEYPGNDANFIVVDGASSGQMNADGGFNLAAPTFAAHPEIKYWLICACLDDYADGAARAAEQAGIDKNCVATTCGGSGLINHWDAGEDSCWKSAVYCAQTLFAEPIFFALYAYMSGQATPETIFPEWKKEGEKYPYVKLPTYIITKDTYKEYMEWVDKYTGINWSPYDSEYKGTEFSAKVTPSA